MTVTFIELEKKGRMGNQLFQASSTIGTALKYNDDWFLPIWSYAHFFNIPQKYFKNNIQINSKYDEPNFSYNEIPNFKGRIVSLSGYWQSPKYWQGHENIIKQFFTPNVQNQIDCSGYTSIHVRRQDYLKFPNHHPVCTIDYYEKAMNYVGGDKFLVFSDDMKWCKNNFKGNQFSFAEGNHEIVDLKLQMNCRNNIIANSSFSWWGAYLNDNVDKIVIAPKKWFGPALIPTHSTKDLIPEEWVQL